MSMTGTRAFYKGTSIQCPYIDDEMFMKTIIAGANEQILESLKCGESLTELKAYYLDQMNSIEKALCDYHGIYHGVDDVMKGEAVWDWLDEIGKMSGFNVTGRWVLIMWFMNIAALLKLKVIENDDKNGWFVAKIKGGKGC